MTVFIFYAAIIVACVWVGAIIGNMTSVGMSLLAAMGLREEVFVNRRGWLIYHKTRNFLPTFPKLVSNFEDLSRSPLTMEQAYARLTPADKERFERTGIESVFNSPF